MRPFRFPSLLSLVALGLAALLSGCLHADISRNKEQASDVADCLPPGTPAPSHIIRAIWFPAANGLSAANDNGMGHLSGVVALSGTKLYFMTYDDTEKHYDMQHVIDIWTAHDIRVNSMAGSLLLVIQSRSRAFDAFQMMGAANMGTDTDMTQELCTDLQAIRAKNPDKDP